MPVKSISIGHVALVKALCTQMHWGPKGTYRILGAKVPDSGYLVFDLNQAELGKRRNVSTDPQQFLNSCPSVKDFVLSESFAPVMSLPEATM